MSIMTAILKGHLYRTDADYRAAWFKLITQLEGNDLQAHVCTANKITVSPGLAITQTIGGREVEKLPRLLKDRPVWVALTSEAIKHAGNRAKLKELAASAPKITPEESKQMLEEITVYFENTLDRFRCPLPKGSIERLGALSLVYNNPALYGKNMKRHLGEYRVDLAALEVLIGCNKPGDDGTICRGLQKRRWIEFHLIMRGLSREMELNLEFWSKLEHGLDSERRAAMIESLENAQLDLNSLGLTDGTPFMDQIMERLSS